MALTHLCPSPTTDKNMPVVVFETANALFGQLSSGCSQPSSFWTIQKWLMQLVPPSCLTHFSHVPSGRHTLLVFLLLIGGFVSASFPGSCSSYQPADTGRLHISGFSVCLSSVDTPCLGDHLPLHSFECHLDGKASQFLF